ncbi:hypothetical protein PHAVU_003G157900, partial [Phaseolus vulgaris]
RRTLVDGVKEPKSHSFFLFSTPFNSSYNLNYLSLCLSTRRGCEDGFGVWIRWVDRRQTWLAGGVAT